MEPIMASDDNDNNVPGSFPDSINPPTKQDLNNVEESDSNNVDKKDNPVASYLQESKVHGPLHGQIPSNPQPLKPSGGVGDLPGKDDESGVVVLPAERNTLPSSFDERFGAQPGDKSNGVGSLPGRADETGVAVLPDERNIQKTCLVEENIIPTPQSGGELVEQGNKKNVGAVKKFEESVSSNREPNTNGTATADDSAKPGTNPAALNSSDANKSNVAETQQAQSSCANTTLKTNGANSHYSKPGFMSKIKGEVKILQGKITKNEDKLEEGRKLKTGT